MRKHSIILFDGSCGLCNNSVRFIKKRKSNQAYTFIPFESNEGKVVRDKFSINDKNINSVILIQDKKIYTKSTATIKIATQFTGLWKLLYIAYILPKPLRDFAYNLVAKNRHRFFSNNKNCSL